MECISCSIKLSLLSIENAKNNKPTLWNTITNELLY